MIGTKKGVHLDTRRGNLNHLIRVLGMGQILTNLFRIVFKVGLWYEILYYND